MSLLGSAIKLLPAPELLELILKYAPAIEALIQVIELHHDEKMRAEAMDKITRGLHYAKETGDTSQLESAIREHCSSVDGCRIP